MVPFPGISGTGVGAAVVSNNYSKVNYFFREQQYLEKEFGAVDHLVMTAFLIISLGLSLNRTLSYRSEVQGTSENKTQPVEESNEVSASGIIFRIIISGGSNASPFINTLCLFGIAGEVFKNTGGVVYILLGMLLSIIVLFITNYFSIMTENNIVSFPSYLRKRFHRKGISFIVAFSSILRHFVGGALNLCVMGIGTSAMTGLSPILCATIIAAAAVACTSASRIHSGSNASIGGTLIWLVGITSLITITVTTVREGGFVQLFSKNIALGKLQFPGLSLSTWEDNTLWGFLTIGMVLGFQIFAFSRTTLRLANDLPRKSFYGVVFVTLLFISIWTFIGLWAGLCVSLRFKGKDFMPDGLLPKLVSTEMENIRGFRGFFVSSLLAASISGVTRRYNQLIELMWEEFHDLCTTEDERERSYARDINVTPKNIPDSYLKELRWERRKKTCCFNFFYKFCISLLMASLSLGIVYMFLSLNATVWELWQSILGIFIGPIVAAMLIGLYFPCLSHMSVCLGLMIGWAIPCYLLIGNKVSNVNEVAITFRSETTFKPVLVKVPEEEMPSVLRFLNKTRIPMKEQIVVIKDGKYRDVTDNGQNSGNAKSQEKSQRKKRRNISIDAKILSTYYGYYGPIGLITCIISSLLFAGTAGKCGTKVAPTSVEMLHPCVRDKFFCVVEEVNLERTRIAQDTSPALAPPEVKNKKKKNALKSIQETANI